MEIDDGGPAFPAPLECASFYSGMSLRDWFAGQALAGMYVHRSPSDETRPMLAREAYAMADAMIAASRRTVEE